MTGRPVCGRGKGYISSHRRCFGSGGAAAMALRAACSGIEIGDYRHTPIKLIGLWCAVEKHLVERSFELFYFFLLGGRFLKLLDSTLQIKESPTRFPKCTMPCHAMPRRSQGSR